MDPAGITYIQSIAPYRCISRGCRQKTCTATPSKQPPPSHQQHAKTLTTPSKEPPPPPPPPQANSTQPSRTHTPASHIPAPSRCPIHRRHPLTLPCASPPPPADTWIPRPGCSAAGPVPRQGAVAAAAAARLGVYPLLPVGERSSLLESGRARDGTAVDMLTGRRFRKHRIAYRAERLLPEHGAEQINNQQ